MINEAQRIDYYFNYLANMSFMAHAEDNDPERLLLDKVNYKVKGYLKKLAVSLIGRPLMDFIDSVIDDENVKAEYFYIIRNITDRNKVLSEFNNWSYFDVSVVFTFDDEKEVIFLKSILPLGIKTHLGQETSNKEPIFVDLFSASQVIDGEFIGIQGMLPIANERREMNLMHQKSLELTLFHHLKVDMTRIPVMVDNLLGYDASLSEDASEILKEIKEYSNGIVAQANSVLELFHRYVSINDTFPVHPISDFEKYEDKLKKQFINDVNISFVFQENIDSWQTPLFEDVFLFVAIQFINNALKAYKEDNIKLSDRKIIITFNKVENPLKLKIIFFNSNTCLSDVVANNAGIKPIKSNSSGLGFYFLNYVLEMFRAHKISQESQRYFEIVNECRLPKFVELAIYFPLIRY